MKYILCIAVLLGISNIASSQDELYKTVKEFFRVNPFAGKFSSFVNSVKTDPELENLKIVEKTDTSLFSVKGNYKEFNPLKIKANKVEMMLAEKRIVIQNGAVPIEDTLVLYQIAATFDSTAYTAKTILNEYKQINRKIKKDLQSNNEAALNKIAGIKNGFITNHAYTTSVTAPISVAWFTKDDGKLEFLIVLRMSYKNNQAIPGTTVYDYLDELR